MYTAVVLDKLSAQCLRFAARSAFPFEEHDFFFLAPGYELPHHMTLNMGPFDSKLNDPVPPGTPVEIVLQQLSYDLEMGVCAAIVQFASYRKNPQLPDDFADVNLKSVNAWRHITVALKPGVKPFKSNAMLEGCQETTKIVTLPEPLYLRGFIQECD